MYHWKGVLGCCEKCPSIGIPGQESNRDETHMCPKMLLHVNRLLSYCTVHGICTYEEKHIPCVIQFQKYIKMKNYTKKEFLK